MAKTNKPTQADVAEEQKKMPLGPSNYYLLLAALVIIVIGFILMAGGRSASPDVFNYEMFSFHRITLAPILVVGGLVLAGVGIMKRPKK
ncbi:MAG: DUF3098 domain-containing protein [Rikenellaceae bacterium]|jgi:hypothetical protein|nr:DUF3098 domain-containing protein [Rikenellaceae bacterium]